MESNEQQQHPYEQDDILNQNIYDVSRKLDKILHRQSVEDHAALLGMIQVTAQRRMHEHQQRTQKEKQDAAEAAHLRRTLTQ